MLLNIADILNSKRLNTVNVSSGKQEQKSCNFVSENLCLRLVSHCRLINSNFIPSGEPFIVYF